MRYRVYEPKKDMYGMWTVELVDMEGRSVTYYDYDTEEEATREYQDLLETVDNWNKEWEEENLGSD